jgi:hypothetical protein
LIRRCSSFATLTLIACGACSENAPQHSVVSDSIPSQPANADSLTVHFETPTVAAPGGAEMTLDDATRIVVDIREWRVHMTEDTLGSGDYAFVLDNRGERPHTLDIRSEGGARWRSIPIAPGTSVTISMSLPPGRYRIESTDSAYADRGVRTTFIVVDR